MAVQRSVGEFHLATNLADQIKSARFTRFWLVSRTLMLLWLFLSLWQIGAYPLVSGDSEARNVLFGFRFALLASDPIVLAAPFVQGALPFSYLPSTLGGHLFPVNDFTLRLPYALIGAAQMPLLIALTNRLFGGRAAVFAGTLLLGSGLFAITRLASGLSVFMAFELAGVLFLFRYLGGNDRRWLIYSSLSFAGAVLALPAGIPLLAIAPVVSYLRRRRRADVAVSLAAGPGLVLGFVFVSLVVSAVYRGTSSGAVLLADGGPVGGALRAGGVFGMPAAGLVDGWLIYLGVPAVLLTLIGLAEAAIHRRAARQPLVLLMVLACGVTGSAFVLSGEVEEMLLASPLLISAAGFGWARMTGGLNSLAARGMVAMAVATVALGGVAWNQAVFNPETEYSTQFRPLREYALSLEHGSGLFEDEWIGLEAIAHVIREETEPNDRIFVRGDVSAAALSLYAARDVNDLDFATMTDPAELAGSFLVIKGEDEAFNGGLSGAAIVVANHRVFREGKALYQLVEFGDSGEPFDTPVWWRARTAGRRLFEDHTRFEDFLPPLGAN